MGCSFQTSRHVDIWRQVRRIDFVLGANRTFNCPPNVNTEPHSNLKIHVENKQRERKAKKEATSIATIKVPCDYPQKPLSFLVDDKSCKDSLWICLRCEHRHTSSTQQQEKNPPYFVSSKLLLWYHAPRLLPSLILFLIERPGQIEKSICSPMIIL